MYYIGFQMIVEKPKLTLITKYHFSQPWTDGIREITYFSVFIEQWGEK